MLIKIKFNASTCSFNLQFKNIINTDPFADLYSRVRPTYDAFISTKNQVGIYEKMERIPGGPKNFMQTALKVVEETQKKIHEFESEVCWWYLLNSLF